MLSPPRGSSSNQVPVRSRTTCDSHLNLLICPIWLNHVFLSFYSSPLNIMWLTYKMSVSPGSSLSSRVKLSTWHLTEVWWSLETDKVTFRDAALWSCDAAAHVGFNTTCGQWRHHQRAPAGGSMLWSSVGFHLNLLPVRISWMSVSKCQHRFIHNQLIIIIKPND